MARTHKSKDSVFNVIPIGVRDSMNSTRTSAPRYDYFIPSHTIWIVYDIVAMVYLYKFDREPIRNDLASPHNTNPQTAPVNFFEHGVGRPIEQMV